MSVSCSTESSARETDRSFLNVRIIIYPLTPLITLLKTQLTLYRLLSARKHVSSTSTRICTIACSSSHPHPLDLCIAAHHIPSLRFRCIIFSINTHSSHFISLANEVKIKIRTAYGNRIFHVIFSAFLWGGDVERRT